MANETSPAYPAVTPYLIVENAAEMISFLTEVFDAVERMRHEEAGRIRHAEISIGSSLLMLSQSSGEYPPLNGMYYIDLGDCDKYYDRAIKAGAKSLREPTNEDYGARSAGVQDRNGIQWWMAGPHK